MKKKFNAITIILVIILLVRLIAQVVSAAASQTGAFLVSFSVFAILYLIALSGVYIKQKWGSILVIALAVIDILFAFIESGAFGFGAGVVDLALLFLGYKEYEQLSH